MDSVNRLLKHFEDGCQSSSAIEEIKKDLIFKASQELEKYNWRPDGELSLLRDFLSSLQYLLKHNSSCSSHLIDQGILQLMKVLFEQILASLERDGSSDHLQGIVELCTDTCNVLADVNAKAKSSVVLELYPYFLDLLQSQMLGFTTRMEVLKSTNMLLEQCPTNVKESLLNNADNKDKISGLISLVKTVGDYEFQVGVIECLMRLFPRKSRGHFAAEFFTDQDLLNGFTAIKDKDFETDCRLFLNTVNAKSEDPSEGVFSLPCVSAFIGTKELRKPSDGGYEEFWVDFNIGSERLTLFCEQNSLCSQGTQSDEDLWETVAIYKIDVQQCCFNEKNGMIELVIYLKSPVCDIYPSQHQDVTDNQIQILFMPELEAHVTHAVGCTFNFSEKRNKVSTVQTPLQISMKDVQHADSESKSNYSVHNSMMPPQSQTGSQESVSRRHKVSVPSIPMTTLAASPMVTKQKARQQEANNTESGATADTANNKPGAKSSGSHSKVSASINNVTSVKSDKNGDKSTSKDVSKEFEVPKTPQRSTRARSKSKVKTPVVTVTPPSKKTKKNISENRSIKDENDKVTDGHTLKMNEECEAVIPDSLPLADVRKTKLGTAKASVSKENVLDDSGIGVDESKSLISNTSIPASPDAPKEIMVNKEKAKWQDFSKENNKEDKAAKKMKAKAKVNGVHQIVRDDDEKAPKEDLPKSKKDIAQKAPNPVTGDELTKSKINQIESDTNFGFDSLLMNETFDSIPDSLEIDVSNSEQSSQNDTCKNRSKTSKKPKSSQKSKAKIQEENIIPETQIIPESESKKTNGMTSVEKKGKLKKKKTFCDVDNSLKELNDLDKKTTCSEYKSFEKGDDSNNEETGSDLKGENKSKRSSNKGIALIISDDEKINLTGRSDKSGKAKRNSLREKKNSGRPKQGKSKSKPNSSNVSQIDLKLKDNSFHEDGKRKLRSKRGNSEKIENADVPENLSPCSSTDVSGDHASSDQTESLSLSPLPKNETPQNSPAKVIENEHKIKSSLKKSKSSDDSTKENQACKRKSRVSFDIPIESQKGDSVNSQSLEDATTGNVSIIKNELNAKLLDTTDGSLERGISAEKDVIPTGFKNNDPLQSKTKDKCQRKQHGKTTPRKTYASKEFSTSDMKSPTKDFSSPVSSNESSDSLYIESDDSYNVRRYRNENKFWKSSKQRRKSSLKIKDNDLSKSKEKNSFEYEKNSDIVMDVSVALETSSNQATGKNREKVKNSFRQSTHENQESALEKNKKKKGKGQKNRDTSVGQMEVILDKPKIERESTEMSPCYDEGYQESNSIDESDMLEQNEIDLQNKSKQGKKTRNINVKAIENKEESQNQIIDDVNDTGLAVVSTNGFHKFGEDEFKKRDWKDKRSNKSKRQNLSYTMKSFEQMECENGYAVSEQSFQTIADSKGRNMVFQMSYSKCRGTVNSKGATNKSKTHGWKKNANETGYDPYDFEAQCENSSMASERIDRKDMSKKLNKKHLKKDKVTSDSRVCGEINVREDSSSSQNSLNEWNDTSKCMKNKKSVKETGHKKTLQLDDEINTSRNKKHKIKKRTEVSERESMEVVISPENDTSAIVIDHEDEKNLCQENHRKTKLVQDKKTKKWYRTEDEKFEDREETTLQKKKRTDKDFPTVHSFNKKTVHQHSSMDDDLMIIDSSVDENNISQFSKILQELSASREILGTNFSFNIDDQNDSNDVQIKTPCIVGSISSTPKVGSGKRKHYYPLNISVIKTPQSCDLKDSDSEVETNSERQKIQVAKRKSRKKKAVKYKEGSDSETEDERDECRSRMSTDTFSLLNNSQNISNRSEKSWILERKKTPKLKKCVKKYKVCKKSKKGSEHNLYESSESETAMEDEPVETEHEHDLQKVKEFLQHMEDSPLTIPSLSLNTPALTPSLRSQRSFEEADDDVTPASPKKHHKKKIKHEHDSDLEGSGENNKVTLDVNCRNSDDESNDYRSLSGFGIKSLDKYIQDEESDDEKSVHKMLHENMKLLLGDSGFASGPSSEVRPSRSDLKRKFPAIEEKHNAISSSSSQPETDDEMERSVFVPKKLFRFDPAVNTPQPPSLYSDATEENDMDFVFQSGLSTVMAAFGADIQNHLKSKKQKIESFTKKTLRETQKHFHQTLVEQQQYQANLTDDFGARMLLEVGALEKDIQKLNDAEKKMEDFFQSQLDVLRGNEESQRKRLSNLKKLQSSFLDKTKKVNKYNLNIHKTMQEQLKKDITDLQRKLVAETQRQEFIDVRTKLQKLF